MLPCDQKGFCVLQLFDYDDLGSRPNAQRRTMSSSPEMQTNAARGREMTISRGLTTEEQKTELPSISKSGRKRTKTLRAELAAAAEASENGTPLVPEVMPPRPEQKVAASRPSSASKLQPTRVSGHGKEADVSKISQPSRMKVQKATPGTRIQPPSQNIQNSSLPAPSAAVEVWCENINNLAPGGYISQKHATENSVRNQVMSDLLCLYFALFRTDVSENLNQHFRMLGNIAAASGADLTKPPPANNNPVLTDLRSAFMTLRYTKHFIKDYNGAHPHPDRPVRSLIQVMVLFQKA